MQKLFRFILMQKRRGQTAEFEKLVNSVFELSKNKWGLTISGHAAASAYSLSFSLHTGDSASLTTAGG
jgi:hypothetical protein